MRQNVTVEQIKELSVEMLNKLIRFINMPEYLTEALMNRLIYTDNVMEDIAYYCTIGRMVEALHNNIIEFSLDNRNIDYTFYLSRKTDDISWYGKSENEPCDLLWMAVKEILMSL